MVQWALVLIVVTSLVGAYVGQRRARARRDLGTIWWIELLILGLWVVLCIQLAVLSVNYLRLA